MVQGHTTAKPVCGGSRRRDRVEVAAPRGVRVVEQGAHLGEEQQEQLQRLGGPSGPAAHERIRGARISDSCQKKDRARHSNLMITRKLIAPVFSVDNSGAAVVLFVLHQMYELRVYSWNLEEKNMGHQHLRAAEEDLHTTASARAVARHAR